MMIYYKPGFRKIITEEREKRNWSIADLAKQAGITWLALMNIESGKAEKPLKSVSLCMLLILEIRKIKICKLNQVIIIK